jgi:hypothetical protein
VAPLLFSSIRVTIYSSKPTTFDKSEPVHSLLSHWSPHPLSSCLCPRARSVFALPSILCSSFHLRRLSLKSHHVPLFLVQASPPLSRFSVPSCFHFRLVTCLGSLTQTHHVTLTGFAPYTTFLPPFTPSMPTCFQWTHLT